MECCKEFGSTIGDHSKNAIYNLFAKIEEATLCLATTFDIGAKERDSI